MIQTSHGRSQDWPRSRRRSSNPSIRWNFAVSPTRDPTWKNPRPPQILTRNTTTFIEYIRRYYRNTSQPTALAPLDVLVVACTCSIFTCDDKTLSSRFLQRCNLEIWCIICKYIPSRTWEILIRNAIFISTASCLSTWRCFDIELALIKPGDTYMYMCVYVHLE